MMPQEWPIAASADEREEPARVAGRTRLRTVRADFFLEPTERLTEQERALMTAMLRCLVGDIASEIRAALPAGWAGANDDEAAIVNALARAGLLDDAGLIALLLRRADEERIGTAARSRTGRGDARAIQGLVSHPDAEVSAAAMGLILARGRRRDRFGQCLLTIDDLSRETAERLIHAIAAALRTRFRAVHGAAAADRELSNAATGLIAKHERARSGDSLTASLVAALHQSGALTDELLLASAREGEVAFLAEALGRRAGISGSMALDELLSGNALRLVTVLRLAELSRSFSAALLASFGDLIGIEDSGAAIESFDAVTAEEIQAAATWLATPASYRAALDLLGNSNG